jgi:hypothetical protein
VTRLLKKSLPLPSCIQFVAKVPLDAAILSPEYRLEAYATLRRRALLWVLWISRQGVFQTTLVVPEANVA